MIDLVVGPKRNALAANQLISLLQHQDLTGTLYTGYPVIASSDDTLVIDALLTCLEYGVVVFDFGDGLTNNYEPLREKQNDIYAAMQQKYMNFRPLRQGRNLSFDIHVVTFVSDMETTVDDDDLKISGPDRIIQLLNTFTPIDENLLHEINAATQRVTTIKPPRKRSSVTNPRSRGAVMKDIEKEIANLDRWQNAAAIESPDGVQRIRGLAGSGKTVILALKAAYLHASNPDWRIALTFQTRSLYQQFRDLVRRFTFEHIKEEPDWTRLQIVHAWGGANQEGLYSLIAQAHNVRPKDFSYGKQIYGNDAAFDGICQELLNEVGGEKFQQIYDAILIDEAQDFPHSLFELAYLTTKEPHRVIYAYDELQNLSVYSMAPPPELFGKDQTGIPRVTELRNEPGMPAQDIVLPICYRNTPWALTVAHGVGFGIYRQGGLVQFFDDPSLWQEIGYQVVSGELASGRQVALKRRSNSYPRYFDSLMEPSDVVICKVFNSKEEQARVLADSIHQNLTKDELEYRDILIIVADPLTARQEAAILAKELERYDIPTHLAGVTSSRDELFNDESVAISGIYRAKGNEAAMVYVVNCDYGYRGLSLNRRRNTLFTAITRSRAWVRLFGCGTAMEGLKSEIEQIVENGYQLKFKVPTGGELARMRKIHRDRTAQERKKIEDTLSDLSLLIESGDLAPDAISPEMRKKLEEWLLEAKASDDPQDSGF